MMKTWAAEAIRPLEILSAFLAWLELTARWAFLAPLTATGKLARSAFRRLAGAEARPFARR
jgi:hypothetical protein